MNNLENLMSPFKKRVYLRYKNKEAKFNFKMKPISFYGMNNLENLILCLKKEPFYFAKNATDKFIFNNETDFKNYCFGNLGFRENMTISQKHDFLF